MYRKEEGRRQEGEKAKEKRRRIGDKKTGLYA